MRLKFEPSAADKGFTLIEVLITMVIVSVGLLAMAQMLITTTQQNSKSEGRMDASSVAQALLIDATTKVKALTSVKAGNGCTTGGVNVTTGVSGTAKPAERYYNGKIYAVKVICKDMPNKTGIYLLIATVTDQVSNQVTTSQMLYTTLAGG